MVSSTSELLCVSICNPVHLEYYCSIRQCSGTATSTGWNFRFGRRAGETVDSELQEESGWLAVLRLVGLHDLGC